MRSWKRILIGLGIAIIGGLYVWAFGPQTMLTLLARYKYRGIPEAAQTPVALTDLSVSSVPHKQVSYFGYDFELPWDDVDEHRSKTFATIQVTAFRSGNALWFSQFRPREFVETLIEKTKLTPERFRQVYGDQAFESDYGFMTDMLQITPRDITPWISPGQAAARSSLLLTKAISIPKADSGIFSISATDFRGFQFENPTRRPTRITDDLYGEDEGVELIFFQQANEKTPAVSQAEINRILQTIRKTPRSAIASN